MNLSNQKCTPCAGGTPPMAREEIERYLKKVPRWRLEADKKIIRDFKFKNFKQAMAFVNHIAEIAETEDHHPDIAIVYNRVTLTLWTHATGGLAINDFIMAAKVDALEPD